MVFTACCYNSSLKKKINAGVRSPFKRSTLRIAGGVWLLLMTVLIYSYSSLLISSMTAPQTTPPMETLEDVANSKGFVLYLNPDSELGKTIMVISLPLHTLLLA